MGSQAIVVAGQDADAIERKFGIRDEKATMCYTRTDRPFFTDPDTSIEVEFYRRVRNAVEQAGLWEELDTDWIILDCELMPWSYKAQVLLRSQYATTAANNTLAQIPQAYARLSARDLETDPELRHTIIRRSNAAQLFRDAYRNYCWEVKSIENIELAPFHVMASVDCRRRPGHARRHQPLYGGRERR